MRAPGVPGPRIGGTDLGAVMTLGTLVKVLERARLAYGDDVPVVVDDGSGLCGVVGAAVCETDGTAVAVGGENVKLSLYVALDVT